jgi:anti-sigma B factor antagonist
MAEESSSATTRGIATMDEASRTAMVFVDLERIVDPKPSAALSGELDIVAAHVLSERLVSVEQGGATGILLDLRDLTFIDSTGVHALIEAWDRAHENGHRLLFFRTTSTVRRLFEMTGAEYLLDGQEALSMLDEFTQGSTQTRLRLVESAGETLF